MNKILKCIFYAGLAAGVGFTVLKSSNVKAAEIRYNGDNRIETAVKIAQSGWPSEAEYAVITAADDDCLIDSLIVAPLAKAYDAPILVNFKGDKLDAEVFEMLKQWGVKKVFIASSENALKKGVEDELTSQGISVERLGKDSIRETSLNIANELKLKLGNLDGAFIVSEDSSHLVDALSVASIAGIKGMPILVAPQGSLPSETKTFLSNNNIKNSYVIGGTSVLSDGVLKDANATRISGTDRYKTNFEVLNQFKSDLKFDTTFFSSGNDGHLVDALAGSVLAAEKLSPIILVGNDLTEDTKQFIKSNLTTKSLVEIFGAAGAVSNDVETEIDAAIYGEESGLLSVKSADSISSSMVMVEINHRVNSATASQFKVLDSSGNQIDTSSAEVAPWDDRGRTVLVTLSSPMSSGNSYTINTVQFDGISDSNDKPVATGIKSTDYDKIEISFSEPVRLDSIDLSISGSDDSKLQIINKTYVDGNPEKIEITTSDQKDTVLYNVDISGAKDFLNRVMDEDSSETFMGIGKDITTKLSIVSAEALTSKTVLVTFNTRVDAIKAMKAYYYRVNEEYTSDASLNVEAARMAGDNDTEVDSSLIKNSVILTLSDSMKDSTVYKITVNGLTTSSGVELDDSLSNVSFIGVGPFTSKMDMADDGNSVAAINSKKIKITFKRHMNTDLFVKDNFSILRVENNAALKIKSLTIIDDRNIQLEVENMSKAMYKLTLKSLLDVDNNGFEDNKNSKIFQGMDKSAAITAITSADLQSDNATLILTFDGNVGSNAEDVSNYSIDNGIGYPIKAELVSGSPNVVKLTISKVVSGRVYKITIKGLENADGDVVDSNGITSSFVGGAYTTLPVIKSVEAADSHTIQITFDRSVMDSSIEGAGKIWTSATSLLNQGVIIVKGISSRQLDSNSNLYVYQNPKNENMLIIRGGVADYSSTYADSNGNLQLQVRGIDDSSQTSFKYNNSDIQPIVISDVKALDKNTVRVTFNQPVKIESNAVFAWISNSLTVANYIKTAGNSVSQAYNLTRSTPTDGSYLTYDFVVSGGDLSATDNWLVVNPAITSLLNGVHDYVKSGVPGFVTLADEDSTNSGIQQVRQFKGSTSDPGAINNISVSMEDSKTIAIQYPEVMNAVDTTSINSALNNTNYKLVDKNNIEIGSGYLATHICNIAYDYSSNKVIISLNTILPSSNNGYYIQFANTIQNTLGTKYVRTSTSDSTSLKSGFTPSTQAAEKLEISSASYVSNSKTLTIKLNQKATSLVKYDTPILLADFKITVTDSDNTSYDLQGADIESVTTNISDSYSSADNTITVLLKSSINGTKTLKTGTVGKIQLIANNTLRGVNGEGADGSSSITFAQ
jgi:putative cell wall-binding protein